MTAHETANTNIPTTIPNETIWATTLTFANAVETTRQTSGEIELTFTQKDARVDANNNGIPDGHFTRWIFPTLQTNGATIPHGTRVLFGTPNLVNLASWWSILWSNGDRFEWDANIANRIDITINPNWTPENNNRVDRVQYLGVDTATMGTANIYPNPATDIITISTPQNSGTKKIEIYNIIGKKVYTGTSSTGLSISLDVSEFPAGVYLLVINSFEGEKLFVNKFIKD